LSLPDRNSTPSTHIRWRMVASSQPVSRKMARTTFSIRAHLVANRPARHQKRTTNNEAGYKAAARFSARQTSAPEGRRRNACPKT
jgi:hypothetical protein